MKSTFETTYEHEHEGHDLIGLVIEYDYEMDGDDPCDIDWHIVNKLSKKILTVIENDKYFQERIEDEVYEDIMLERENRMRDDLVNHADYRPEPEIRR